MTQSDDRTAEGQRSASRKGATGPCAKGLCLYAEIPFPGLTRGSRRRSRGISRGGGRPAHADDSADGALDDLHVVDQTADHGKAHLALVVGGLVTAGIRGGAVR